jgi:hypothetical protein
MISRRLLSLAAALSLVLATALALTGCAGMEAHQKESNLSAAGFRVRTPTTPKQQAIFKAMKPYKMQRRVVNGKLLYAYADAKQGVIYVGTETEYQAYKKLSAQQQLAEEQQITAVMNQQDAMDDWEGWGPYGMWY